ncbi:trypsin-like peptidase domain-containing protein [Luteipulveratus sp. YIM 133132]|uniref:S1C family serine protease n=1 Tax=Luteipulveratus flavus TaxID=3031728 RepID=UPI0023AF72C9|nr:trypsin-like peptidase domain-containing protein [Luteipulveratus sp. YIM 133132]MDE9365812.1 trypsin-like peptidase domain-containing protein [Luteipulveratus sp. YIM 133132]
MTEHGGHASAGEGSSTEPIDIERTDASRIAPPGRAHAAPGQHAGGQAAGPGWQQGPPPQRPVPQQPRPPQQPVPPPYRPTPYAPPGYQPGRPGPSPYGGWGPGPAPASLGQGPYAGPQPRRRTGALVGGAIGLTLLAGAVGGAAGYAVGQGENGQHTTPVVTAAAGSAAPVADVAKAVLPSVVTLKVADAGEKSGGTGSGFVMRADGYIVTNNHVVSAGGANGHITVLFSDGSEVPGKLVGKDASYDLAVVKVNKPGLAAVPFGESKSVSVGDPVIAVGSPLGLDSTVTTGIVSALNRPVSPGGTDDQQSYINAIQTDAAINPGNSGGPLLDRAGRVVGVNSAIARIPGGQSEESGSIGVGFAIPSDQTRRTAEQLIRTGKAQHPIIGAFVDQAYTGEGAKISGDNGQPAVSPGGPAAKAGLKAGDVILQIDGQKVRSAKQLIVTIRARQVGDTVALLVRSGGQERTVRVTLAGAGG